MEDLNWQSATVLDLCLARRAKKQGSSVMPIACTLRNIWPSSGITSFQELP